MDSIVFLETVLDHFIKIESASISHSIKFTYSLDEIKKLRYINKSILNKIKSIKDINDDYLILLRERILINPPENI